MSNVMSFEQLKSGLEKVRNLGILEEVVDIHGMHICISTIRVEDHRKVLNYVGEYMKRYEGEDSTIPLDATMDFFAVRKIEPLSHAIQSIGDMDFRGVDYVETGEVDENGNVIKKEKHVVVREILREMDPAVVDTLHEKYADLLVQAEKEAGANIKFRNPEDELAVLEQRRKELYKEIGKLLPEEAREKVSPEPERAEDHLSVEGLKAAAFTPIPDEEIEAALTPAEPVAESSPEQEEDKPDAFEAGGQKFIRLEDPDTPYTEEEQVYLEEQEKLFQQRYGGDPEEAKAALQKRRRQPLNRTAPRIQEGPAPSAPLKRSQSRGDRPDLPMAEGFDAEDSAPLQDGRTSKPVYNPAPSGTKNSKFKDPNS